MGPLLSLFAVFSSLLFIISPSSALCVPRNGTARPAHAPPPSRVPKPTPPSPSPAPTSGGDRTVSLKAICARTDHPDVCDSLLKSHLAGSVPITPRTVLEAHMTACSETTSKASAFLTTLMGNPLTRPIMGAYLGVCKANYADAQDNIEQARVALAKGDTNTLNTMVSAAMSDFETCDDGFMELPGGVNPLASFDDTLSKIGSNCLAIAEMV